MVKSLCGLSILMGHKLKFINSIWFVLWDESGRYRGNFLSVRAQVVMGMIFQSKSVRTSTVSFKWKAVVLWEHGSKGGFEVD